VIVDCHNCQTAFDTASQVHLSTKTEPCKYICGKCTYRLHEDGQLETVDPTNAAQVAPAAADGSKP
jgi:hypothetical protein